MKRGFSTACQKLTLLFALENTSKKFYPFVETRVGSIFMHTKVQKMGDSLVIRIPKTFASKAHLESNTPVEISIVEGNIIVAPTSASNWTLDEMLANITKDNIHDEVATGSPIGKEIW